jgi:signal transduction histidine kinase
MRIWSGTSAAPAITKSTAGVADPDAVLREKRRLLALVRTGLTLAISYLIIFSAPAASPVLLGFVVIYLASNVVVAVLPTRIVGLARFDVGLILFDTGAISAALLMIPEGNADVFIFYFAIILLASISDRLVLSLLAPIVTSGAYLAFVFLRDGSQSVLQPAVLLRLPFFLLTGAFYGFFVDHVRRGQTALAEAKQRTEARTELLSAIAHDLKQPLWIAGQSAALLYDQLGQAVPSTRELAAQVIVSLKRMEALTLNFLDLNRLEVRGLRVAPRRVALNRIVQDLIDAYRPALELKNLQVVRDLSPAAPLAWIDPLQTERCLANLLDNAIKYTPAGGTITCRTECAGDTVVATIGDSGPGISADRHAMLFSRFQDGADAAGRGSTGLGLHIARALAVARGAT